MKKYEAVLFDMDGVITDSMHWHAESWQKAFHDHGVIISKEDIFIREGMSGLASIIDILKEKHHPVPSGKELESLMQKKLSIFETNGVKLFPYVKEILGLISDIKLKSGLVTGSLRRSVEYMLKDSVLSFFDVIVTVDDITNGKPHPEPYLNAMKQLNVAPDETLVIENAPLGIISAKEAGADCYAIETSLDETYLKDADKVFKNHELLFSFLKDNL
ncbi:MAG: HAD family phosphatase [Spirochaetota bacterium]